MEGFDSVSMVGHLEYILLILAFMLRDIFYLRLVTLLSSSFAIIYYSFCLDHPLYINIFWESVFSLVNIYQIGMIFYEKYFVRFTLEEEKIYKQSFSKFTPLQFKKLLQLGKYTSFKKDDYLIKENEYVDHLSFICEGKVEIIHNGRVIAYCHSGSLIGELSFLAGGLATADTKAIEDGHCLVWEQKNLKKLLEKDEEIFAKFQLTFSQELAKKIVNGNQYRA